jgi:hypothetical protein
MPLLAGLGLRAFNKFINVLTGYRGGALESDESEEAAEPIRRVSAA